MSPRFLALLAILWTATALADEAAPPKPCKEHPLVIDRCFTVHGELKVWNGNPTFRLTQLATGRILGVSDQRFRREGYENLPAKLKSLAQDGPVVADFEVCPFTRDELGVMQLVCVQAAKGIQADKGSPRRAPAKTEGAELLRRLDAIGSGAPEPVGDVLSDDGKRPKRRQRRRGSNKKAIHRAGWRRSACAS